MRRKPAAGERKTALDNTPDLTPFTSPFNYVIIFTIQIMRFTKRRFLSMKIAAYFYMWRCA